MRRDLYKYIVIIICVLVFWLLIVPFIFSKAVPIICENLSYNTQYNVKIENPRLYLNIIPVATVNAKKILIESKDSEDVFHADEFKIRIRVLPLLSGRVHIDNIQAEDIGISAVLDKKIQLDKNFISVAKNTKIICDAVDIRKIRVNLYQENQSHKAFYSADNILYKNNGRYIKLNADSAINVDNVMSNVNVNIYLPKDNDVKKSAINIRVSNLDIAPITDFFRNYLPKDLVSAKGTIDADIDKKHLSLLMKNIKIEREDSVKSMIFPQELKLNSTLNLTRNDILIDNAEIKSDNIDAVVSGTISKYLDRPVPEYNIKIRLNKSKIEDFISMLPDFKTEDIDMYKLKKYKFYGDIIGNFSVTGEDLEPDINGHIFVNNGVLTRPIPNASGAVVKLNFKGKYLNFDVLVPAGGGEKVTVKGGVELYNLKYSDMHVWSTQNVDLATAEEKVVPVHEILNFVIGPVPIMDIKGSGNIDINIKGNRKNPHVWGVLNFKNVTTNFLEIPDLILQNGEAILSFDDENVVFNLKKGVTNGKNIKIDGVCNLSGKFNFDVEASNQQLEHLYKAIKTSTMIDDIKNMIPPFDYVNGLVNLKLKVYGNIKDIEKTKFNENFFTKGTLELLDNRFEFQGVSSHNTKGIINFDNTNVKMAVKSYIGQASANITASVKDNYADVALVLSKLNLRDIVPKGDKIAQDVANIFVDVKALYKGRADKIEYDKLDFDAQLLSANNGRLELSKGNILLKNGRLQINDLNGSFINTQSSFNVNLKADNIHSHPVFNGNLQLRNFELFIINSIGEYAIIPKDIRNIIKTIRFEKGKIYLNAKISNNNINASTNIGGIEFVYTPLDLPVKVINGSIYIRKHFLGLNKINIIVEEMPILLDGGINNIFNKPDFNLYFNSKLKQSFIDKYINNKMIYPLKIKGDVVYWAKLKGTPDDFNVESEANLAKDSSFYYMGATVGDVENGIIITADIDVIKRCIVRIKEFSYDKLIDSQGKRRTRLNMLKVAGGADILSQDILFCSHG